MINDFEFLNNFADAVCVFAADGGVLFKNNIFKRIFFDFTSTDKFKKRFNFDLCLLSSEDIGNKTPIDLMLSSCENFHTVCSYRNTTGEYSYIYIYTFFHNSYKVAVFRDISAKYECEMLNKRYSALNEKFQKIKEENEKNSKLKEKAASQVLKMGIINRISLVIRETNDMQTIISGALSEIHNLAGAFKTYFSLKDKGGFNIVYSVTEDVTDKITYTEYEKNTLDRIKNKEIAVSSCRKEFANTDEILPSGVKRVIIPVCDKNKLLGIIVTLTKQKFSFDDNLEVLQSIAVQLGSSVITSGLIAQLNKKNKKLQKTLSELRETQMQLINTEKMASLGQLVSGVAHEINTPLASINSNTGLITKLLKGFECESEDKKNMLEDLNNINSEAVKRISSIVKSLKKFVRLDEAEFQPANINDELDLTLKIIEHETKNNINIVKRYGKIPPVTCSVNMLNQVFMNLLVNSCRSIKKAGRSGEIVISTECENSKLTVKIKDNGTGIAPDIRNKIFNPGFTTGEKGIATGLGLAISKKIIELHKGSISFSAEEGKGAEFSVVIPINEG